MMRNTYSTYLLFILVFIFCITNIIEELKALPTMNTTYDYDLPISSNNSIEVLNTNSSYPLEQKKQPAIVPKKNITQTKQSNQNNKGNPVINIQSNEKEATQFRSIIESFIWADMDGNGKFDQGEIPLPNITVRLLSYQGLVLQMTTTDYKGAFVFDNLESGDYMITADLTTVSYQMRPSTPSLYYISLFQPTIFWTEGFGFVPHEETMTTLTGNVTLDPVKQTQLANKELDVQVNLLDQSGYIIGSVPASADGSYAFYNIEEGIYSVERVLINVDDSEEVSLLHID